MNGTASAQCESVEEFHAAVAAGDLGRVIPTLTLGLVGSECRCVNCCTDGCPKLGICDPAQKALGELAQRVTTGQLQLARGTLGAMQLLALTRESVLWQQHAAAEAFVSFAGTDAAPQLPLAWWRDLLCKAVSNVTPQLRPAVGCIVARCNEVAARLGQPALPAASQCHQASAISAAFSGGRSRDESDLANFPALAEILASATGIAEHVRPADIQSAARQRCVPELLRLGPHPSPTTSQQLWQQLIRWGERAIDLRLHPAQKNVRPSKLALPVYVEYADDLDALIAAGHYPEELWGVKLGPPGTPDQRMANYDALLATRGRRLTTLQWLTALAASGLEWSPESSSRWPVAVQKAVTAAFGAGFCQPSPQPGTAAAAGQASRRERTPRQLRGLRDLPLDVQKQIAGMVVRPISKWLPLPRGTRGSTWA